MSQNRRNSKNGKSAAEKDADSSNEDVASLIRELNVNISQSEERLKQHIDNRYNKLDSNILENRSLITRATDLASNAQNLAEKNS